MRKIVLLIFTVLFALSLQSQNFLGVTKINHDQSINLSNLQVLEVKLPCRPSTGYGWYTSNIDKGIIRQVGDWEFIPDKNSPLVGQSGTQIIRFIGVSKGISELSFEYRRPWEKNQPATDNFKLTLNSKGKYTGDYLPTFKASTIESNKSDKSDKIDKSGVTLPSSFSWQPQCTPIKDQGQCGSCWAFGASGSFEAVINIKDNNVRSISEQWLINCTSGMDGCQGGNCPDNMFVSNGAVYETDLPYSSSSCNTVSSTATCIGSCGTYTFHEKATSTALVSGTSPTVAQIKQAIYSYGPVWIAIDAGNNFQNYKGGVFTTTDGTTLDHAPVLVGWKDSTALSGGGYWILRNSWGDGWGEHGYMRIEYGISGVGSDAQYIVYEGGMTACSGTPAPGNTVASVNPVCSGINFTLSLQTFSGTGVTYQWQSSTDDINWSNISNATNATLTTSQTGATWYQCQVTCSGSTGTSVPLQVTMNTTQLGCYCLGTYSYCGSSFGMDITKVVFGSINNSTTAFCNLPYIYNDYTSTQSTTVTQGLSYPISISSDLDKYVTYWGIWVDWNNSGSFTDNTNKYTVINNTTTSVTGSGTIVVPAGATVGNHRMRIRANYGVNPGQANACANLTYGEQEDYNVNVISPCTPPAATISAQGPTNFCQGSNVVLNANTGSGLTYQWLNNSVNIGSASNTSYTASASGSYSVIVSSGVSCSSTSQAVIVTVNPSQPVSVSIGASANSVCTGTAVTFTATPTNGGTSPAYQWMVNTLNVGTNSSSYTYNPNNGDIVSCVLTSNAGCATGSPANSNPITIIVNSNLPVSVSIAAGGNSVCQGTSVTFTATPTNGGTSPAYQWIVNTLSVGTNSSTYTYVPSNGDNVSCVLTSSLTCAANHTANSNSVNMIVNPNLPVSVSVAAGANSVCSGTSVTFTATPTNGGTSPAYQWEVNGTTHGNNSSIFTYTPNNTDAVKCVLTSNAICATGSPANSNTVNMIVNSNQTVSVSVAAGANPVCSGTPVTFTATPTNGGTSPAYQWIVNTLDAGTNSPTYTYIPANGDAVSCVLTSSLICASGSPATSNPVNMVVNSTLPVSVSVTAGANPVCSGTSVTFTATPTNGGTSPSYQWIVNTSYVGTNSPTFTYTPVNGDIVSCVLTSSLACAANPTANSNPVTMTVNPNLAVSVSVSAGANSVCSGTGVTFTATPTNGGTSPNYQWIVNSSNVGTNSPVYNYVPVNGDVVSCILTSSLSCVTGSPASSNKVNMIVNSNLPVSVSITTGTNPLCSGTSVTFTATPTNGGTAPSYQWKVNGLNAGTSSNIYTYTPLNGDVVTCVLTSSLTCTTGNPATSNPITMAVNPAPTATTSPAGTVSFCTTGSVTLTANTGTGYTYQWQLNSANISGSTKSTYKASAAGNYRVIISNSSKCSATSQVVSVLFNTAPTATVTAQGSTTFCTGGSVVLNANTGTGYKYQWRKSSTNISGASNSSYTATAAASYNVIITNSNSCSATSSSVTVTVNTIPAASVTPTGPINLSTGGSTTLKANSNSSYTYQWQKNGVNISGSTKTSLLVSASGVYLVNETIKGCVGVSNSVTVTVNGSRLTTNDKDNLPSIGNNYPNPFSNTTQIDYTLPEASQVILKVYNMIGQEIKTLVNSNQDKGDYKVTFSGDNLTQGVYMYTFIVKGKNTDYTKTKLMIFNK